MVGDTKFLLLTNFYINLWAVVWVRITKSEIIPGGLWKLLNKIFAVHLYSQPLIVRISVLALNRQVAVR